MFSSVSDQRSQIQFNIVKTVYAWEDIWFTVLIKKVQSCSSKNKNKLIKKNKYRANNCKVKSWSLWCSSHLPNHTSPTFERTELLLPQPWTRANVSFLIKVTSVQNRYSVWETLYIIWKMTASWIQAILLPGLHLILAKWNHWNPQGLK